MIEQQINLYQEQFRITRLWLSARDMLMLLLLVVLALAASGYWYQQQLNAEKKLHDRYVLQQQQASQALQAERDKLEKLLANKQLEKQIFQTSDAISVRKRLISFVEDNGFGSGAGFSGYLSSLSEINAPDLWLNEISLSQQDIRLAGSALKATSIPQYFSQIQQRRLFSGRRFDVFEVNRSKARAWKVDFLIASRVADHE